VANLNSCLIRILIAGIGLTLFDSQSHAELLIDIQQAGGNVVITGSGSVNTTGLINQFPSPNPGSMYSGGALYVGSPTANVRDFWSGAIRTPGQGNWGQFTNVEIIATSGSNGLNGSFGFMNCSWLGSTCIVLPTAYISGSTLNASSTYAGTTLSLLNLRNGTYNFTWGSGANTDSLTLQIGPAGISTGNPAYASNPYSTTFNSGTLIVDAFGSYSTNYTNGAGGGTININGKISTFSGVFSGPGALSFTNTINGGKVTLSGVNTYAGATTVNTGSVVAINGDISSSSGLTVNPGGTIAGSGTLPATTIAAGGFIAPGNSIGTVTIAGNYALAGGTLLTEIQGPQNDQIIVTGTVTTFTGTASQFSFGGGTAWPGFDYQIITANASTPFATSNSLTLDHTQITPSALLQLGTTLIQEADGNPRTFDVQWRPNNGTGATASAMQSLGVNAGYGITAAGLFDSAFSRLATAAAGNGNAGGAAIGTTGFSANQATAAGLSTDFVNRLAALLAIPTGAQLQVAVGSSTPESYAAFQSVGLNSLRLQREMLSSQAGNCKDTGWIIHSGSTGKTGSTTGSRKSKNKLPLCAFATGGNATSTINGSNGLSGYDSAIAGGYYGLELEATKKWTLGAAYGYGNASLSNFGASANSVSSIINSFSIYSIYKPKSPWSVKGILGYGNYNLSGRRNLIAIGNGNPLTANTNANGYTAAVNADYSLPLTKPAATLPVFLKPILGLAYGAYQQNGFSESGDATMNLNVASHTSQSLIGTVGAELVAAIPLNQAKTQVLKPRLAVAYQVDALDNSSGNNSIDASLPAAGGSLTTNGQTRGVNDLTLAGTLEYVIVSKASLYATASYEAFSTGSQFAYGGGIKISF